MGAIAPHDLCSTCRIGGDGWIDQLRTDPKNRSKLAGVVRGEKARVESKLEDDESERAQVSATEACQPTRSSQPHHQFLSDIRRVMGGVGPFASPASEYPSFGWRPASGSRPDLRQRHLLRAAYRLPVEGVGRHGHLLRLHRPFALSGMGCRRGVPGAVAGGTGKL